MKDKFDILAVGANPDDIELLCAGTLAKYVALGHNVSIYYVTTGDKGHTTIPSEELISVRQKEAEKSASMLGIKSKCLGLPDGDFYFDRKTLNLFVDMIRLTKPDVIITHSPNDYFKDHIDTSHIVCEASFFASAPYFKTGNEYEPCGIIPQVYFTDTVAGIHFEPTEYVDITDYFKIKVNMLSCHKSQIDWLRSHDQIDLVEMMTIMAKFRGLQVGVQYAEGFRKYEVWRRLRCERLLP